jgi:hypothetical protein
MYELAGGQARGLAASAKFFQAAESWSERAYALDLAEREEFELGFPFDARFRLNASVPEARRRYYDTYDDPSAAWRRIDYDWLSAAADFALQLDNLTNNTSLALAFEIIDDGRVLLFPADAQVGNWLSWHELKWRVKSNGGTKEVTARDLLRNTVFYKVGHHSSHNATMKEHGLEMMQRDDLIAFIPVDQQVAKNKKWKMPAESLYDRLLEKTTGRVVQADTGWPPDRKRPSSISKAEWDSARRNVALAEDRLYFELTLE